MTSNSRTTICLIVGLFCCLVTTLSAQDPLRSEQYKALKALPEVVLLVHQPDPSNNLSLVDALGLNSKDLSNVVTIRLSKDTPALRVPDTFRNDRPYLEIGWYGNSTALVLSLSVWRWARIEGVTEAVFSVVWKEENLLVTPSRQRIRDTLDDFATRFAADYLRANR